MHNLLGYIRAQKAQLVYLMDISDLCNKIGSVNTFFFVNILFGFKMLLCHF